MVDVALGLDDVAEVPDYSNATIRAIAERLKESSSFQEFIAREIELDELWRRVETGLKMAAEMEAADLSGAATQRRRTLEQVFGFVTAAHDLAGEGRPLDAASRLRDALALRTDAN